MKNRVESEKKQSNFELEHFDKLNLKKEEDIPRLDGVIK